MGITAASAAAAFVFWWLTDETKADVAQAPATLAPAALVPLPPPAPAPIPPAPASDMQEEVPAGQLKVRLDTPALSPRVQVAVADLLAHLQERLASEDYGLKPPPATSQWFRLRVPQREGDPSFPSYAYTAGTAAITAYAPDAKSFLEGGTGFYDPVYAILDRAVELGWCTRLRTPWTVVLPLREAANRWYAERLVEELESDAKAAGRADGAFWPGRARARPGSLENLPPTHPLVQDRDRFLDLFRQFAERKGPGELATILNFCNDTQLSGVETTDRLAALLQPLLPEGTSLFPKVTFATREPWTGTPIPVSRMRGVRGQIGMGKYKLDVSLGEQRTTPHEFMSVKRGSPTLLYRVPLAGNWALSDVGLLIRRSVKPDAPSDPAASKIFWIVILDPQFRELHRWPFTQAEIPVDQAGWINLTLPPCPELPKDFFFLVLEFEEPGEGADVELCVRPNAEAEHCFWSVAGREVKALDRPLDFAVVVGMQGHGTPPGIHPNELMVDLQKAAQKNAPAPIPRKDP